MGSSRHALIVVVAVVSANAALAVDLATPDRWWRLDDGSGKTVKDSSGNGVDGKLVNCNKNKFVDGLHGKALELDGKDDYVDIDDNKIPKPGYYKSNEGAFTVALWFKLLSDKALSLIRRSDEPAGWWSNPRALRVAKEKGGPMVLEGFVYDGTAEQATGKTELSTGKWYHAVMVAHTNGGAKGLRVYLDGKLEAAKWFGTPGGWPQDSWHIGRGMDKKGFASLHGLVDDVRIYNTPLNDSDVARLYELTRTPGSEFASPGVRGGPKFFLRPGDRVMFLGDAITLDGGFVEDARSRIADDYAELRPAGALTFVNAATSGATAKDVSANLGELIAKYRPTVAVVCFGANDVYADGAAHASYMRSMITKLREASVALTVMTPPAIDARDRDYLREYAESLERMAAAVKAAAVGTNVTLADCHAAFAERIEDDGSDLSWGDGVHPNRAGHRLMAKVLLRSWGIGKALRVKE